MANHFRETAEKLRQMAHVPRPSAAMTDAERETLEKAASILCRLEQLKRDFISIDPDDEGESDRLCAELLNLLGLHVGGTPGS